MTSLAYECINALGRFPRLFSIYYARHHRFRELVVREDTKLVLEGFPRCANSFAVLAFERAQAEPVRIAHHLHSPAQIVLGVRFQLPILALIREPVSAVASLVTRHPEVGTGQALRSYASFYGAVQCFQNEVVLADFRSVTTDYGRVIRAVNDRFGTAFDPYSNCPEEDEAVFREIDKLNEEGEGGQLNQLARPSDSKKGLLAAARARVLGDPALPSARAIYDDLVPRCV